VQSTFVQALVRGCCCASTTPTMKTAHSAAAPMSDHASVDARTVVQKHARMSARTRMGMTSGYDWFLSASLELARASAIGLLTTLALVEAIND
jgi:hypothetical protein